ncbi:MAG: cupin domain-containing protein [Geminicoccaceae bacterium]
MELQPWFVTAAAAELIDLAGLGIAMRVLLPAAATGGRLVTIEETTAPGMGPPLHVHHAQMETFYCVEGAYAFQVGEQRFTTTPGAAAMVPPGVPHAFRNIADRPSRQLFTLTPAGEGEAFFRELAALGAGGPPDPAALAALAARFGTEFVGPPLGG